MRKTFLRRSVAVLLSLAMLLAYAPGLAYLGIESSKTQVSAATGEFKGPVHINYHMNDGTDDVWPVTLQANGGKWSTDGEEIIPTTKEQASCKLDYQPDREGYLFRGWFYDEECEQQVQDGRVCLDYWDAAKNPEPEFNVYAGWEKVELEIGFYTGRDENHYYAKRYAFWGDILDAPADPVKPGYLFVGWANEDGVVVDLDSYQITENEQFWAKFVPIVAEWKYIADGNLLAAECATAGANFKNQTVEVVAEDVKYDGEAHGATLKFSSLWSKVFGLADVDESDIVYTDVDDNVINGTPVNAGTYKATLTIGGQKAVKTYKIEKIVPDYTAPAAIENLRYNHDLQSLATAGEVDVKGLYFVYSLNDGETSTDVPMAGAKDAYTVNWQLCAKTGSEAAKNYDLTNEMGSFKVVIHPQNQEHIWTYASSKNVLSAVCADEDCTYDTNMTVSIYAEDAEYTGEKYDGAYIKVSKKWAADEEQPDFENDDIVYYPAEAKVGGDFDQSMALRDAPKAAGEYYATIAYGGKIAYAAFVIDEKAITDADFTAPTAKEGLVFNNEDQVLINAGKATNGTMMYYVSDELLEKEDFVGFDEFTKDVRTVTGKEAGTYYVYYGVKGDDNYQSYLNGDYVTVEIAKKGVEIVWSDLEFEYDGDAHKPTATVTIESLTEKDNRAGENADIKVEVESDGSKAADKTETEAGEYIAKVVAVTIGDDVYTAEQFAANYEVSLEQLRHEWKIIPRAITIKISDELTKVYGDEDLDIDPYWYDQFEGELIEDWYTIYDEIGMFDAEIKTEIGGNLVFTREPGEDAGTYEVTAALRKDIGEEAINYNYNVEILPGTFTITKKDVNVVPTYEEKIYGEADPTLDYDVFGLVNYTYAADRKGVIEEKVIADTKANSITGVLVREVGENVGFYDVNLGTLAAKNYNLILVNGEDKFEITQRPVYADQITWGKKSFKYDGKYHLRTAKLTETGDASGLAKRDKAFYLTVAKKQKQVGTYTAEAFINNNNYMFLDTEDYTKPFYIVKNNLIVKATPVGTNQITLKWNSTVGASYYKVYGTECNSSYKYIGRTWSNSVNVKKIKNVKLKSNTAYKFYVVAYNSYGKKIATSIDVHSITNNVTKSKKANVTSITTGIAESTLTVGQETWIASWQKTYKGIKWLGYDHAKMFRYTSTDTSVATVDKKGFVTATGEGTCTIYVQAVNGLWKAIKVTVK